MASVPEMFDVVTYQQYSQSLEKRKFDTATELLSMAEKTTTDAEKAAICRRIILGISNNEFKKASGNDSIRDDLRTIKKCEAMIYSIFTRYPCSIDLLNLGLAISQEHFMPYFLVASNYAINHTGNGSEIIAKIRENFYDRLEYMVINFPLCKESGRFSHDKFFYDFDAVEPDIATVQMWVALLRDYAQKTDFSPQKWHESMEYIDSLDSIGKETMDIETARHKFALLIPQYIAYYTFSNPIVERIIDDETRESYKRGVEDGKRAAYAEVREKLPQELPARVDKAEYARLLADVIQVSDRWEPHSALCEFMVKNALVYTFDEYPPLKYGDPKKSDVLKIAAAWYDFRRMRDRKQNSATTIAICDEVLKRDPKDVNAAALKAVACVYREDFPAARRALAQAEKLGLNDKDFLHQMAKNLVAQSAARQRAKEK